MTDLTIVTMASNILKRLAFKTLVALLAFCGGGALQPASARPLSNGFDSLSKPWQVMVADLEKRTFQWFWDSANPSNGLIPDHYPGPSFSSIASVGFGLTAYGIGAERGFITREQAVDRTLTTLRFFTNAREDDS